jgi:hypothetical protein
MKKLAAVEIMKKLFQKAMLKLIVDIAYVDWSGRRETPAGVRGWGEPRRRLAPRRLPGPPANRSRLERKSTGKFNTAFQKNILIKTNY